MSTRRAAAQQAISALYRNDFENEIETSDNASDSASESEDHVLEEENSDDEEEEGSESESDDPQDIPGSPHLRCRNASMSWSTNPPTSSQTRAHNIFRENSGPTASVRRCATTKRQMLEQFLTPEIQNLIIIHTNAYAQRVIEQQGGDSWLARRWQSISCNELMAFIGTLLLIGIYRSAHENYEQLWSEKHGRSRLRATMSLNRFKILLRMIRFDDKRTR